MLPNCNLSFFLCIYHVSFPFLFPLCIYLYILLSIVGAYLIGKEILYLLAFWRNIISFFLPYISLYLDFVVYILMLILVKNVDFEDQFSLSRDSACHL